MKLTVRQLRRIIKEALLTEEVSSPPPGEVKDSTLMRVSGQYMVGDEIYLYKKVVWDAMSKEDKEIQWNGLERVQ